MPCSLSRTPDPHDPGQLRMLVHAHLDRAITDERLRTFHRLQRFQQGNGPDLTPVCQPDSELTPPASRHNMAVHQLTVVRAWACQLTTPPMFQPLASLPLLEPCGEISQPLRGPHIPHGDGEGTGLPDDDHQLLPSGHTGIEQIAGEHGIVLRGQRDHDDGILGPLAFMHGCCIGQGHFIQFPDIVLTSRPSKSISTCPSSGSTWATCPMSPL